MRYIFALFAVLIAISPAAAWLVPAMMSGGGTTTEGGGATYLFSEDFESGNTQWTKASGTATGNFAYATSPAPLVGSYSLLLDESSGSELLYRNTTNWTAAAATYAYAQVNITTIGTVASTDVRRLLGFRDGGTTNICAAGLRTSSSTIYWAVQAAGATAYTSITPSAGTTYHLWLEYVEGSGTGSCSLYVATSATKPGSASAARSNLNLTTDAVRIIVGAYLTEVDGVIWDKVRVDDEVIGSDPS